MFEAFICLHIDFPVYRYHQYHYRTVQKCKKRLTFDPRVSI